MIFDPSLLSIESLTRASVILAVGILLLFSSLITICILLRNPNLHDVIGFYLVNVFILSKNNKINQLDKEKVRKTNKDISIFL